MYIKLIITKIKLNLHDAIGKVSGSLKIWLLLYSSCLKSVDFLLKKLVDCEYVPQNMPFWPIPLKSGIFVS